jgi:hypothetical protein
LGRIGKAPLIKGGWGDLFVKDFEEFIVWSSLKVDIFLTSGFF